MFDKFKISFPATDVIAKVRGDSRLKKIITILIIAAVIILAAAILIISLQNINNQNKKHKMVYSPSSKHDRSAKIKKSELVYVNTDANGKVKEVSVDATLKNNREKEKIVDMTSLSGLENTSGDEKYIKNGNGTVTWDTPKGEDISYQGRASAKNLPLSIKVKYYLNGKKISGSDLEGKTGKIKIVVRYKNNATENINGINSAVPFVCLSSILFTGNSFNNIKVTPGKLMKVGSLKMAIGIAVPGLSGNLKTDIMKKGIGDTVVIKGTAKEFSSNELMTLASSDVLKIVSNKKLRKLDADSKIGKLETGTKKLVSATKKLSYGTALLHGKLPLLTGGIDKAAAGSKKLRDSLIAMKAGALMMKEAFAVLSQISQFESTLLEKMETANSKAFNADKTTGAYINCMHDIFDTEKWPDNDLEALKSYLHSTYGITISVEQLGNLRANNNKSVADPGNFEQQSADKNKYTDDSGNTVKGNAYLAEQTLSENLDTNNTILTAIQYMNNGTKVLDADRNIDVEKTKKATDTAADFIKNHGHAIGISSDDLEKLRQKGTAADGTTVEYYIGLADMIKNTEDGLDKIIAALGTQSNKPSLISGSESMVNGMRQLEKGTSALTSGVSKLDSGSAKFAKGMNTYYKKGISKLLGLYNNNLKGVSATLQRLKAAGKKYDNFSGLSHSMDGSATFMYFVPLGNDY